MARKREIRPLAFRIFVGDRPLEELTAREREAFGKTAVRKMGQALNEWTDRNPGDFARIAEYEGGKLANGQ